jgi:hypothetical protein
MEITINKEARAKAMKEYFTKGELIVINEALYKYQYDCKDRADNLSNKSGINTNTISKLQNIASVANELRQEFEPFPL